MRKQVNQLFVHANIFNRTIVWKVAVIVFKFLPDIICFQNYFVTIRPSGLCPLFFVAPSILKATSYQSGVPNTCPIFLYK